MRSLTKIVVQLSVTTCLAWSVALAQDEARPAPPAAPRTYPGPSDEHPGEPLPPFDAEVAARAIDQAKAIDEGLTPVCEALKFAVANKSIEKLSARHLAFAYAANARLRRVSGFLIGAGEAAGFDYASRAGVHGRAIADAIRTFQSSKAYPSAAVGAERKIVVKRCTDALERGRRIAEQGNPDAAERILTPVLDLAEASEAWFLDGRSRESAIDSLRGYVGQIDGMLLQRAVDPRRIARAAESAEAAKRFGSLAKRVLAAAEELKVSGDAAFGESRKSGPAIVREIIASWRTEQDAYRMAVALAAMSGVEGAVTPLHEQAAVVQRDIIPAVTKLIENDAISILEGDVVTRHQDYVATLAELEVRMFLDSPRASWEPALTKLVAKSPEYAKTVETYRVATNSTLAWRRRVAASKARRAQREYGPLFQRLAESYSTGRSVSPLFGRTDGVELAVAMSSLRMAATNATDRLIGLPVAADKLGAGFSILVDGAADPGASNPWVAPFDSRVAVESRSVDPSKWQVELESLEADLLVGEGAPPLTLEAAAAVLTARLGRFVRVGAPIESVRFEGLASFLGNSVDEPTLGVRIGASLSQRDETTWPNGVVFRIRLGEPDWLQHECFFVDLAADDLAFADK